MKPLNVLLIEDDDSHAKMISRHIQSADTASVRLVREDRLAPGIEKIRNCNIDVILLDLRLPDSDIDRTLSDTVLVAASIPIVVLSSLEDRDLAIRTVHEGAQEYLCKSEMSADSLIRAIYTAIERKQSEARFRDQALRTKALFELGQHAIAETDLSNLMKEAVRIVANSLGVEYVKLLELQPGGKSFLLRAGFGWKEGLVGKLKVEADSSSPAGYTVLASRPSVSGDLSSHRPIIVSDIETDRRFSSAPLLLDHGVKSGVNVVIYGKDADHPYGVLGAHTRKKRNFSLDEADFLQAVANTLAAAISRHNLEQELKRRVEDLDTAHRRKDEFLATLSHELRTPLNVILGYVELLNSADFQWPSEFREAFDAIERNARAEAQLVSDTLEMSRIITGKLNLQLKRLHMSDVIRSAIESIKFAAVAKDIEIKTRIAENLPDLVADEARLSQVIWNLLSNAVKFTHPGGRIEIEAFICDSTIGLSVQDTGQGIAPENLPHVFERFWQEDASISRHHMGLGVGLAIVRHIVELHGGTVRVRSEGKDRGTVFTVYFPIARASKAVPHSSAREESVTLVHEPEVAATGDLHGRKILVIDDSRDSLQLLARLLEKEGATVKAICSPWEGLKEAQSGHYDIIMSDIGMPDLNGYELMRQYREWEKKNRKYSIPAIAVTAYASDPDAARALDAGYQEHLAKPISRQTLDRAIHSLSLT